MTGNPQKTPGHHSDAGRQGEGGRALRHTAGIVAALNLGYFGVEFAVATTIGSVSLFADSTDFLEDALVNLLVLLALGWSARRRAGVGIGLSALLLMPGVATGWSAVRKFLSPAVPAPVPLTLAGGGAMLVNLVCAVLLARFRHHGGSLTRAAFLSARNDVLANVAIVGAGFATVATASHWPDLVVGLGIFAMNLDAAREVLVEARRERRDHSEDEEAGSSTASRP